LLPCNEVLPYVIAKNVIHIYLHPQKSDLLVLNNLREVNGKSQAKISLFTQTPKITTITVPEHITHSSQTHLPIHYLKEQNYFSSRPVPTPGSSRNNTKKPVEKAMNQRERMAVVPFGPP